MLLIIAERLVQDRHGERLEALRHVDPLTPVDHERQVLVLATEPLQLGTQAAVLQLHQ